MTNALAYYETEIITTISFYSSGINVIKLFTAISYDFLKLATAFVPGNPFQSSLIFVGKAGAYPS